MADTSTPGPGHNAQPALKYPQEPAPRRSTIAILRQLARLYPAAGNAPIGIFVAN